MGNTMRKVLFVSLFPPRPGGLPLQSEILAQHLQAEGAVVRKINVHYPCTGTGLGSRAVKGWSQLARVVQECRRQAREADQIVAAGCSWWGVMPVAVALLVGRRYGKPVSVFYHGGAARQFLRLHHSWVCPMLRLAHVVAVTSDFLRREFEAHGLQTTVVPPILEAARLRPRRRGLVFISTRYLEPIYDVGTILEAFAAVQAVHPQARLVVAGSGSQQRRLQDLARSRHLNATFLGHLPRHQLPALLGQASFSLNAARVDNMPLSVLEAMYAGAVAITTPVGELPSLMVHGTHGLFFVPGDAESLAETVLFALQHQEVAERCRRNGARLAAAFTWDRVRNNYLRLLDLDGTGGEEHLPRIGNVTVETA